MWSYGSSCEAVTDVLRLSRGMSYKNAMAGFGIRRRQSGDHRPTPQRPRAPPSSSRPSAASSTPSVAATSRRRMSARRPRTWKALRARRAMSAACPDKPGTSGGDPGPKTALGVYLGIKAAAKFRLGRSRPAGGERCRTGRWRRGLPPVPAARRRRRATLRRGRARRRDRARRRRVRCAAVDRERVLAQDVDVFAPCALGAILARSRSRASERRS